MPNGYGQRGRKRWSCATARGVPAVVEAGPTSTTALLPSRGPCEVPATRHAGRASLGTTNARSVAFSRSSPVIDGRNTKTRRRGGSIDRLLNWSHPPGSNRRPADYEFTRPTSPNFPRSPHAFRKLLILSILEDVVAAGPLSLGKFAGVENPRYNLDGVAGMEDSGMPQATVLEMPAPVIPRRSAGSGDPGQQIAFRYRASSTPSAK